MGEFLMGVQNIAGESINFLGSGAYSIAYRSVDNPTRVFLTSNTYDDDKMLLAEAKAYDPTNPHLPEMKIVGSFSYGNSDYNVFETVYSEDAPNDHVDRLKIERVLFACEYYEDRLISAIEDPYYNLPPKLIDALKTIYILALDYDDEFYFEFPTRNLGVDPDGNLILRDILYFM